MAMRCDLIPIGATFDYVAPIGIAENFLDRVLSFPVRGVRIRT